MATAISLRDQFFKGETTAESIIKHCFKQIECDEPKVGAFLALFKEQSMEKARHLDLKRQRGEPLGKLAGVPIAIKDNIHMKGQLTTCASKFLENYKAPFDATVVRLLEEEDAILIGKTNLDEFAMGSSTETSAYQKTYNPWNLSCTPGGSSGGSAAACAARFCPIALGTDTGGSIRQPAAFTGIVGFKPTYGRVSRYGLVAYGSSLDQIGPFATTVADAALAMEVIGRHCPKDATSLPINSDDYSCLKQGIQGMKIGVPWQFLEDLSSEPRQNFEESLKCLQQLGATLVEVDLEVLKASIAVYYILATAEASTNLARFDGIRYGLRSKLADTLDDVYDLSRAEGFGREVKRRILLGTFVLSAGYQDAYYKKAQKVRRLIIDQYKEAFKQCAIIATPVTPFTTFEVGSIQDPLQMYLQDIYTIAPNLAGLPGVSVPSGLSFDGKPYGLQLLAPAKQDVKLLQAAAAFESISPFAGRVPEIVSARGDRS
ncbi:MAG: glutamyl-tRNA(Gln) amidotransferase subunit [Chlamydiales bacterium]|jgi:aspartyl-tRNA(Asn)/glutamyl-tRNA(Gln) amidotransferase subunit A|nr:glutamyl-tRNA(Gln) amidotransferase subunit [Chlamydiales bacterium]